MFSVLKYTFIPLAALLLQACKINQFDRHGNRKGKWISYWNDTQIQAKGKYKAGWQKGVWKYYDQQGQLRQKQIHHKNKIIDITYYHANGFIDSQGKAKIHVDDNGNIQFFWFDKWLFYNPNGTLKAEKYYLEGQAMESEELTK